MSSWERQIEQRRTDVLALPGLPVAHHAEIVAPQGLVRASSSIGPSGELASLWAPPPASGTAPRPGPVTARVERPNYAHEIHISELALGFRYIQPMPDGGVLLVAARCQWRESGPDLNGICFDADGNPASSATFGDGIQHVYTTESGNIWVGYFDEGVYGNYGWGSSGSPAPIGENGLVRFGPDLTENWRYPSYDISDCYALNVDGETAWTCFYTDFPVVKVHNGGLTRWSNQDSADVRAIAVFDDQIAFCGGYSPERDRIAVGNLADGEFHRTAEYRLVLPDGSPLPDGASIEARGPRIHITTTNSWYVLSEDDWV